MRWMLSLFVLSPLGLACSSGQPSPADLFSSRITEVVVEVDYQVGAEPFTGSAGQEDDLWAIFGENLERMFQTHPKTLTYPRELADMEALTDISGETFSQSKIFEIADRHRQSRSEGARAAYYIVFVDGYYERDGEEQRGVIGVSFGTTGVIAVFKPVITRTDLGRPLTDALMAYTEQGTLVHEFAHAAGLVNLGVPLTSDHHDAEQGAHCSNDQCVMYWANQGLPGLIDFVQRYFDEGTTLMFAPDCLQDMDQLAADG